MKPVKVQNKSILKCPRCGYEEDASGLSLSVKTVIERSPAATPVAIEERTAAAKDTCNLSKVW